LVLATLALPLVVVSAGPPDVAIAAADISFSNDFPKTGENVGINVTVHNVGGMDAAAVVVRMYIDQELVPYNQKDIALIKVNETGTASFAWPAVVPGTYTFYIKVNCTADTNMANNQASRSITVTLGGPLMVSMALDPASCKPEQTLWANGTVRIGTQPASGATVTVTVKPSGTPASVTADASGMFSANLTAPKTAGRYEVEASATSGALKGNDTRTLSVVLPDLVVTGLIFSKEKPLEGDTVRITATVRNNGTDSVGSFMVAFYFDGTKFSTEKAGPLTAGNQTEVVADWTAVKGTHQMKATADPENKVAEINEEDNSLTVPLTVKEKAGAVDNATVMLIVGVVAVAIVAVAVIWILRGRKKKAQ
jgi:hypothetical protein